MPAYEFLPVFGISKPSFYYKCSVWASLAKYSLINSLTDLWMLTENSFFKQISWDSASFEAIDLIVSLYSICWTMCSQALLSFETVRFFVFKYTLRWRHCSIIIMIVSTSAASSAQKSKMLSSWKMKRFNSKNLIYMLWVCIVSTYTSWVFKWDGGSILVVAKEAWWVGSS